MRNAEKIGFRVQVSGVKSEVREQRTEGECGRRNSEWGMRNDQGIGQRAWRIVYKQMADVRGQKYFTSSHILKWLKKELFFPLF